MPKAGVNKRRSWLYKGKLKNVRKKIKRLEHKADRKLSKENAKREEQ